MKTFILIAIIIVSVYSVEAETTFDMEKVRKNIEEASKQAVKETDEQLKNEIERLKSLSLSPEEMESILPQMIK